MPVRFRPRAPTPLPSGCPVVQFSSCPGLENRDNCAPGQLDSQCFAKRPKGHALRSSPEVAIERGVVGSYSNVGDATAMGRRKLAREMPVGAVAFRWAIAFGGVALLAILNYLHPTPISHFVPFLLGLILIVLADGFLAVRVGPGSYFNFGYTFLFAYFLFFGGLAAASLDALTRLIVWGIHTLRGRTQRPMFAFFSVGQSLLSVLAGAWAVEALLGNPAVFTPVRNATTSLFVFSAVYLASTTLLSSLAVWARAGWSEVRHQLWPTNSLWTAVSVLTSIPFALFVVYLRPTMSYMGPILVFAVLAALAWILNQAVRLKAGNDELKAINRIG